MKVVFTAGILGLLMMLSACSGGKPVVKGSNEPNLKQAARINVELGSGYLRQGRFKLAKTKLEKAIEQDPKNALAYSTMALLNERIGKLDEVERYYTRALQLDPDNADVQNNYGTFLCNQRRFKEAHKQFQAAWENPFYQTPHFAFANAGACALKQQDYPNAEEYFRRALQRDPKFASVLFMMAELGISTERYLLSRAYIQRFHEVNRPTAASLWLQIQAEKALGAVSNYQELSRKLLKDFPDSNEAAKLIELKTHD